MSVVVRFAPSPTGRLHVGNARMALANWLFARKTLGRFILRIDDTDRERSEGRYVDAIKEDLVWLGIDWNQVSRQSERFDAYAAAFEQLRGQGRIYACYETADELAEKRERARAKGRPPVYDRAALALTDDDRTRLESEGRRPHWRFRLDAGPIEWIDLVRGSASVDSSSLSDPVVGRDDGKPTYHLASALDEIEFAVTHVLRGEDHVANTAVQIQLIQALGGDLPAFAHIPLMLGPDGESLSKRLGSVGLASLREDGIEPLALVALLAHVGTSDSIVPVSALSALVTGFDFAKISRSSPKFDPDELWRLNAKTLHAISFEQVADRLVAMKLADADETFWRAVRGNLRTLGDVERWWRVCRGEIEPVIEDPDFLDVAASLLPKDRWSEATWTDWTHKLGKATGRKGKALYHPLRLALTASENGPELRNLLPVIGRDRALARLSGRTA